MNGYLRTCSGAEGARGALGVYQAAFVTTDQTEPLQKNKGKVPLIALGGEKGLGAKVQQMVKAVADVVEGSVLRDGGRFIAEEAPDDVVRNIRATAEKGQSIEKDQPTLCGQRRRDHAFRNTHQQV